MFSQRKMAKYELNDGQGVKPPRNEKPNDTVKNSPETNAQGKDNEDVQIAEDTRAAFKGARELASIIKDVVELLGKPKYKLRKFTFELRKPKKKVISHLIKSREAPKLDLSNVRMLIKGSNWIILEMISE
ncbi:uncharacterized protein LOC111082300 [Drosophila obscura]|uniref:uncharacterized protein LOC111082300 n=1 Tax=Drosophila obscura TaxID=7282 RepID=UPI001BB0F127|nr:uncharacterized protein LOC111082300 [Drosophila obscura]